MADSKPSRKLLLVWGLSCSLFGATQFLGCDGTEVLLDSDDSDQMQGSEGELCGEICDPWSPDGGCADNEKCIHQDCDVQPGPDRNARCVPFVKKEDQKALGESCSTDSGPLGQDNCEPDSFCLPVRGQDHGHNHSHEDEHGTGTCVALCAGSQDEPVCPEETVCVPKDAIHLCLPECDPRVSDACVEGAVCVPSHVGNSGSFACRAITAGPNHEHGSGHGEGGEMAGHDPHDDSPPLPANDGEGCLSDSSCTSGTVCSFWQYVSGCEAVNHWCCTPYCSFEACEDPSGEDCPCHDGEICTPIHHETKSEFRDVGQCLLPPELEQ